MGGNQAASYDITDNNGGKCVMDKKTQEYTDAFVAKLKTTGEYLNYKEELANIRHYPELMDKINFYREENFVIQNTYEGDELYDKLEEFSHKYEDFLENTTVNAFLTAEAAFTRMLQDINTRMIEGLEFL